MHGMFDNNGSDRQLMMDTSTTAKTFLADNAAHYLEYDSATKSRTRTFSRNLLKDTRLDFLPFSSSIFISFNITTKNNSELVLPKKGKSFQAKFITRNDSSLSDAMANSKSAALPNASTSLVNDSKRTKQKDLLTSHQYLQSSQENYLMEHSSPSSNPCLAPLSAAATCSRWSFVRASLSRVSQLFTLLMCLLLCIQSGHAKIRSKDHRDPVSNIRHVLPELELGGNNSVTDVEVNLGSTAFLSCRFPSFPRHHESRVSWIRRWDWHILTAGLLTYTNDDRFVVLHRDGTNEWILQIKFVSNADNGTYECQVHTGSGFMSQFVNLHVITPRAVILEPRTLTVKNGENFSLTCIIQQSLQPPVYVMWLHAGVPVNYAPDRPRLEVLLEPKGTTTRSILSVRDAKYTDSGNYTCTAPNAVTSYVLVYVTEGDTVAAVQRRQPESSSSPKEGKFSSGSPKEGSLSSSFVVSTSVPKNTNGGCSLKPTMVVVYMQIPLLGSLAAYIIHCIFLKIISSMFVGIEFGNILINIKLTKSHMNSLINLDGKNLTNLQVNSGYNEKNLCTIKDHQINSENSMLLLR